MNTDLPTRIREEIAALPVPPRPQFVVPRLRSRRARMVPVTAAAAVLAVLFIGFVPWGGGGSPRFAAGDRPATLPDRWAGYSYLTGSVGQSPPGPAIAVYQQGFNVELFDFPQALVLSAYADVYRRVDLADDREDSQDQADPAPMLISPDGRRLAVGSHNGLGNLALLDLSTGNVTTVAAGEGKAVRPLAWSRDGRRIAALELPESAFNQTGGGDLVVFDLDTGTVKRFEQHRDTAQASFSPDGTELAIQGGVKNPWDRNLGDGVRIIDLDGRILRTLSTVGELAGDFAWSPDGRLIATREWSDTVTVGPSSHRLVSTVFLDATGQGRAVPDPIPPSDKYRSVLGWTGPDRLLIRQPSGDHRIMELNLGSGEERVVTELDTGANDNFGVGSIHFASNLLLDIETRPAGEPDRGPLPRWMQGTINTVLTLAGLLVAYAIRRRIRGRFLRLAKATERAGVIAP